ncbi:uncharacterized protein CBL_12015 [Carabus blaptoides fortunei]
MAGVFFVVCVPTANYEHRLQYGCPMKSDESADDGENLIKLDIELRNKNSIQNVVSKIGDHYKQYGTSSTIEQDQESNIRKFIPMEKILDELLTKLNIEHVVWCGDKNANYYEVFFPLASGEPCENCLHCLTEIGIGVKWNSLVSVLPCSVVYSGVIHDQTKHNDDLTPEESSAWSNFVDSVKSKLTVKQVVNGVQSGGDLTFDYIMLILTADCLAALGLVENNAPNIVAAMLVSPLMGPVMSVTFGTIIADRRLQRTGFITLATGIIISIVFGFIFGLLLGTTDMPWGFGDWPTEEMKARGNARCLWIGVLWALPSGTGVALALLQGSAGPLIGVAISASLLPPVVNCGLFWALACIWLARDNVKMPHMAGESYTGNSSYVPIYADYMPTEFFINGIISGLLTVVNVVFIFVSAIVMLKIKEVAAPYTSTPDVRRFWERDIRLVRENNQSMHRSSKQDSTTAQELTDERLDSVLEAAVRVAQDDDTLNKQLRMSMVTELNTLDQHIAALLTAVTPHSSPAPSRYHSFRHGSARYRRSANVVLPTILETTGSRSRSALSRTISLEPRIISNDAASIHP